MSFNFHLVLKKSALCLNFKYMAWIRNHFCFVSEIELNLSFWREVIER